MRKPRYNIGDYVRVCKDLSLDWSEGITPEIIDLAGQLVQISSVDTDDLDFDDLAYEVKELKGYYWKEDWFEYRLGNYEDNNIQSCKYHIGFNFKGRTNEYVADEIKTLNPEGLCEFTRKDGKYMSIPYNWIEYIIPLEKGE